MLLKFIQFLKESINEDAPEYVAMPFGALPVDGGDDMFYRIFKKTDIDFSPYNVKKSKYYWFRPTEIKQCDGYSTVNYEFGGFAENFAMYSPTFKENINYFYSYEYRCVYKIYEKEVLKEELPKDITILW